jgi:CcmD family protein
MKTMHRILLAFALLFVLAAPALADEPPPGDNPLAGVNLDKYKLNREKGDIPVDAGRRFLADLKAVSPDAWASVTDAVRLEIQKDETAKFAHQKQYVIYAYGAIWAVLAIFVIGLFMRQRHLANELAELERRVGSERK